MKIMIFTPFAYHNGAEKMLWAILKYADRRKFQFVVYSYVDGPLKDELPPDIPFFSTPELIHPKPLNWLEKTQLKIKNKLIYISKRQYPKVEGKKNYIQHRKEHIERISNEFKPDLWYVNTVQMSDVTSLAEELGMPFTVHFHDMLYIYTQIDYESLRQMVTKSKFLIGCAQCVCNMQKIMGGKQIELQYECVDVSEVCRDDHKIKQLKERHNIPINSFIWIMSGTVDYRKGFDIIPKIAKILGTQITIICLGKVYTGYGYYIEQEIEYYNLTNVIITGFQKDDYYDYLQMADGFLLTSREDPFPLVMIEAASFGLPIVSFNSGGVKEFVEEGMGLVIDSNTPEDFADAMQKVMNKQVTLNKEKSISRANQFDARVQVEHWQNMMSKFSDSL